VLFDLHFAKLLFGHLLSFSFSFASVILSYNSKEMWSIVKEGCECVGISYYGLQVVECFLCVKGKNERVYFIMFPSNVCFSFLGFGCKSKNDGSETPQ